MTAIYTSAYKRTGLTIAPTAAEFRLTPTADACTNEWYFGDMTSVSDLNYAQIYGVFGAWAAGNTSAKLNLPHAESLDDMIARVLPAWQEMIAAHQNDNGVVVIVGHGAEMGYVMPYLVNNVSASFAAAHGLQNTGIVDIKLDSGNPYVVNWQGVAAAAPVVSSMRTIERNRMVGSPGLDGVWRGGTIPPHHTQDERRPTKSTSLRPIGRRRLGNPSQTDQGTRFTAGGTHRPSSAAALGA